jgi:ubiquinone/menaquinone biosynthesis C-methylase UbiE
MIHRHVQQGIACCDEIWEQAYRRFETPDQEIAKFTARLRRLGAEDLNQDSRILELFCGRGGGLHAWKRLGFSNVEGLDLSESLLNQYDGNEPLHLADCRDLPFDDHSFDLAVVQGGLHHLPDLNADLEACLSETRRVLRPDGEFWIVEPWMTPFLKWAHRITNLQLVRTLYAKGDALATMTEQEAITYFAWLNQPDAILQKLHQQFRPRRERVAWGKLEFAGTPTS